MAELSAAWFAIHIRMHDHARIETALQHKGFEVLSPYYFPTRIRADGHRKRTRKTPLFPGYLFCSLDPRDRMGVLMVPGVKQILGIGATVTPVPAAEIEAVRLTLASGLPIEPCRLADLEPGELVEVLSGPLTGVRGTVVYHKGKHRVVITVSALSNRAVAVEVDRDLLKSISQPAFAGSRAGLPYVFRASA
jgi:transcription antitermination factor NusG